MNIFPMKTDLFNMNSIIDYTKLINQQANEYKVIASKESFVKKDNNHNKHNKQHIHRTQNK